MNHELHQTYTKCVKCPTQWLKDTNIAVSLDTPKHIYIRQYPHYQWVFWCSVFVVFSSVFVLKEANTFCKVWSTINTTVTIVMHMCTLWRKELNVLFNNTLNTFIYGYMVNDHSSSERGIPLLPLHGLYSFQLAARIFYMHHATDRIVHNTAFHGTLAEIRNSSMCPTWRINPIAPWATYISLCTLWKTQSKRSGCLHVRPLR